MFFLNLFFSCFYEIKLVWFSKVAKIGLVCSLFFIIDYDYEYFGYGDYRGGYSDPYYDDYYRYEDYYFDYPPAPPARGRARQPQPVGSFDC